jgi:hypothetical protein
MAVGTHGWEVVRRCGQAVGSPPKLQTAGEQGRRQGCHTVGFRVQTRWWLAGGGRRPVVHDMWHLTTGRTLQLAGPSAYQSFS